jgi:divalent metal cation (Fe/Co/Zn/Cd) transporter
VLAVPELLTMHVGPDDILVAARLELDDELSTPSVERVMDELQRDVHQAVAAVRQIFIDPTPAHAHATATLGR